ncbi:MAG: Zn-ribbon containing protein, partial [Nanoarchaeota archaeon]
MIILFFCWGLNKIVHQCVHCGKIYPEASKELLEGCSCGSHFFFYIKGEQYEKLEREKVEPIIFGKEQKKQIERDVREMIGIDEEEPVILDIESIKVVKPGKFMIDIVNLFSKKRPLIYKLEEGKYIIDLASSLEIADEFK